jgi:hypothetical protein
METDTQIRIWCVLWRWWLGRNKLNSEKKKFTFEEVWRHAEYWTNECKLFCKKLPGEFTSDRITHAWKPPAEDHIKLNIDGAFALQTKQGGWGFVARDHLGEVRGARTGRILHAGSGLQTEAIACMEAVEAASDWGMGKVHVETDCANLVAALTGREYDLAPEGVLFREIRSFVSLNFISFKVSFCSRLCNKVGHVLASMGAKQTMPRCRWVDSAPDDVCDLVAI